MSRIGLHMRHMKKKIYMSLLQGSLHDHSATVTWALIHLWQCFRDGGLNLKPFSPEGQGIHHKISKYATFYDKFWAMLAHQVNPTFFVHGGTWSNS